MTVVIDTLPPELRKAYNDVHARHMAADRHARRQIQQASGVSWSGMAPEPYAIPSTEQMLDEARGMVERAKALEAGHAHQARIQIAELTKGINALAVQVEEIRAALSREDGSSYRKANIARQTLDAMELAMVSLQFHCTAECVDQMEARG